VRRWCEDFLQRWASVNLLPATTENKENYWGRYYPALVLMRREADKASTTDGAFPIVPQKQIVTSMRLVSATLDGFG
jgi:hypothetical protein